MKKTTLILCSLLMLALSAGGGYWFLSQSRGEEDSGSSQVAQWRVEREQADTQENAQEDVQADVQADAPDDSPPEQKPETPAEPQTPENLYFDGKILQLSPAIRIEDKATGKLYLATYDQDRSGLTLGGVVRVVYQEETAPGVIQALSIKQTGQEPDTIGAYVGALQEYHQHWLPTVVSYGTTGITNLTPAEKEVLGVRISNAFPSTEVLMKTMEELAASGEPTSWEQWYEGSREQVWNRGVYENISSYEVTSQSFKIQFWFGSSTVYLATLNPVSGVYSITFDHAAG